MCRYKRNTVWSSVCPSQIRMKNRSMTIPHFWVKHKHRTEMVIDKSITNKYMQLERGWSNAGQSQWLTGIAALHNTTVSVKSMDLHVWHKTRQAMYVQCNTAVCSPNHCCHGKAISIKYYECVFVALVVQHAKLLCHLTLSSLACLALPYFSTLSPKPHNFLKKKIYWI
jgi:hypothetical protein